MMLLSMLVVLGFGAHSAAATPSYVVISAAPGAAGSDSLPQQLAKWRQLGLVADALLLRSDATDRAAFDLLGLLEFPDEAARQRWQQRAASELGQGLVVTAADALAHGEKYPRDSSKSTFLVTQYQVLVPRARYQEYVDGYVVPQMEAWKAQRVINRYTSFYAQPGSGAPWQSLLLMEYRDAQSFAMRDQVKEDTRRQLTASDERFQSLSEKKKDIRKETTLTRALWVDLPPPDLSDLPAYEPQVQVKGGLRIAGSELKNAVELLAEGFAHYHPDVKVATSDITSSEGAIAGLYLGVSDVAPMGDDAKITDVMPFYNSFGYLPTEISVATGGYEKRGSLFAWAIVVNKNNPLDSISVDQLKRVFGGERTGGWEIRDNDYMYTSKYAMKRAELIRTWGQLGLKGKYANKEIETFGYVAPGFAISVQRMLLHWSQKWNANFREYVEEKQATPDEQGHAVTSERPLEDLQTNEYSIGIAALMHVKDYPSVKVLAVVPEGGGEPIPLTPENVANRSYPLIRDAYFYVNKAPGQPLDPRVREFMRYCLSREGQEAIVKAGYYYPLPREYLEEQRKKLD